MSYNGSGTFQINSTGQPVVSGTVISSTAFNALTADLATGLSTAITKDGQTATTARIPFAQGINSTLVTDSTSTTTGSIITAGGAGVAKALFVGTTANVAGAVTLQSTLGVTGITTFSAQPIFSSLTASSAVATDASKGLVSVTNTGTGNNVLATSPTLVTPALGTPTALVGTNITGTATAFNINGTVGATTATTGAFTTLSASGVTTVQAGSEADPAITTSGDTNTGIFFPAADTIAFSEGGAEAMRINSSGYVGIGTTNPAAPLHISGVDVDLNAFRIVSTTGTNAAAGRFVNTGGTAYIGLDNSTGARIGGLGYSLNLWHEGAYSINFGTSNSARASINASGSFILVGSTAQKATGTTWSNPSDFRLKDNIRDYGKGLAELMRVRVREWEYNGKGGTVEGTKGLGVVADEVMVVLPDTVENYEAKLNADDEEVTTIKKFDATEITWLLVKTVQEQQALITALTTRITALEAA